MKKTILKFSAPTGHVNSVRGVDCGFARMNDRSWKKQKTNQNKANKNLPFCVVACNSSNSFKFADFKEKNFKKHN